jgi:hypothetical protein
MLDEVAEELSRKTRRAFASQKLSENQNVGTRSG